MKNDWQDKLRDSLGKYEKAAPEGLWEDVIYAVENKRKVASKRGLIWFISSVAVAAGVGLAIWIWPERPQATDFERAVVENLSKDKLSPMTEEPAALTGSKEGEVWPARELPYGGKSVPESEASVALVQGGKEVFEEGLPSGILVQEAETLSKEPDSVVPEREESEDIVTSNALPEEPKVTQPDEVSRGVLDSLPQEFATTEEKDIDIKRKRQAAKRLSLGISSSNSIGAEHTQGGYGGLYGSDAAIMARAAVSGISSQKFSEVLINGNGEDIKTNIKYRQPVRIGLSADYEFSDRIGIETGLTYTLLVSDLTSGASGSHYETRQTLHYVGIPINLKVRMFDFARGNGQVYFSSGGMVEKCVSGNTKTVYYAAGDMARQGESNKLSVKPLQWSVNAAAGCSLGLGSFVSIYFEPGCSYYFDNSCPVETIYKDRPLNFSFRTGFRFSFGR